MDLNQIQKDAKEAIRLLEKANKIAGGTRMGSQEAIASLEQIPELVEQIGLAREAGLREHIEFLDKYLKIGE